MSGSTPRAGMDGRTPPDPISGRDVELIAIGIICLVAAGTWVVLPGSPIDPRPPAIFVVLGVVSFGLAWWDIRSRGELSIPRNGTDDDPGAGDERRGLDR